MKSYITVFILVSLLFPACIRKKDSAQIAKNVKKYEEVRSGTYDEDLGAFVLEDEADYDLFEEVEVKKDHKAVDGEDDLWAWEDLDEDQPAETVYFDFNESKIKKDQMPILKYNADLVKLACDDGAEVIIEGHSCLITRSQMYNQALSQRRADAVKKALIKLKVPSNCVKAVGRGTAQLATKVDGREAQAQNRRVEIKFKYPQ
jgi:outer membrane protein OmpA-like peptidoglycan-associated protein